MELTWFVNERDDINNYVRWCFREGAVAGVAYHERPFADAPRHGLPFSRLPRGKSAMLAERDGVRRIVILDHSDGFHLMEPAIAQADLYFCSSYAPEFHEERRFITPYAWQTDAELEPYARRARELSRQLGAHFHKVRRSVLVPGAFPERHRIRRRALATRPVQTLRDWALLRGTRAFAERWRRLLALRETPLRYDLVARDTLWAWPAHRVRLHERLARLPASWRVHRSLREAPEPGHGEAAFAGAAGEAVLAPLRGDARAPEPYERMLAGSRLAVFAVGYHWGWRQIMWVALLAGTPVLVDRPLYEAYFDFAEFRAFTMDDESLPDLEARLAELSDAAWDDARRHNQAVFDRRLAPAPVREYLVETIRAIL